MSKNDNCICENNCMCDNIILVDLLTTEKNMTVNLATSLNEMSNMNLYDKIFEIFKKISNESKEVFEILYKNGYYELEAEDANKIDNKLQNLKSKESVKNFV